MLTKEESLALLDEIEQAYAALGTTIAELQTAMVGFEGPAPEPEPETAPEPGPPTGGVVLRADGGQEDTYAWINRTFSSQGRSVIEAPDTHSFSGSDRHIRLVRGEGAPGPGLLPVFHSPQ